MRPENGLVTEEEGPMGMVFLWSSSSAGDMDVDGTDRVIMRSNQAKKPDWEFRRAYLPTAVRYSSSHMLQIYT